MTSPPGPPEDPGLPTSELRDLKMRDLRVEVRDRVAVITLDRPDRRNAFTGAMGDSLGRAYEWCDLDDEVRAVVLTGAGDAFCAVLLEDSDQHPRERRRFELTAEAIASAGAGAIRLETKGETRVARLLWATMLGDLVSLELATARGVDALTTEALDSLKSALGRP